MPSALADWSFFLEQGLLLLTVLVIQDIKCDADILRSVVHACGCEEATQTCW